MKVWCVDTNNTYDGNNGKKVQNKHSICSVLFYFGMIYWECMNTKSITIV